MSVNSKYLKPEPQPGQIIRFDYLWKREEERGAMQGMKDRPCVVLAKTTCEHTGAEAVIVCPITHSPPYEDQECVRISKKDSRQMGLSKSEQWVKTDEANVVPWSDPGIIRATPTKWLFGRVPKYAFEAIRQSVLDCSKKQRLEMVNRSSFAP